MPSPTAIEHVRRDRGAPLACATKGVWDDVPARPTGWCDVGIRVSDGLRGRSLQTAASRTCTVELQVIARHGHIGAKPVMDGRKPSISILVVAVALSTGVGSVARSEPAFQNAGALVEAGTEARSRLDERPDFRSSHRVSNVLLQSVLRPRRGDPEWLVRETGIDPFKALDRADTRPRYLALQIDRLDGTDLLTVRQSLGKVRNLQLYAGAGLGRARYLDDDLLAKPLPRRRAHHSLGAAAELGAQAQLGRQLSVVAALRWMEFGQDATLLQSDYGTLNADAAMLGVTVGYRFR